MFALPTFWAQATGSEALVAANNAWMLVCSALVLFMTAPGLAMFYGGLVRRKNVLSVMMQCIFLMGLLTIVWGVIGYSLCFGGSNPFFGSLDHIFLRGVTRTYDEASSGIITPMYPGNAEPVIPLMTFALFQGMFFIITPALICGAFAERMKFSATVAFLLAWSLLIYCPLAHWVWGGGILAYGGDNSILGGALDFAGGTVVHISSGVSALVAALMVGPRMGHRREPMPPHNLTYTALGAAMLWVGWFGFNAGSGLAADGLASSAFCATHVSAAGGAVMWAAIEWLQRGKPTVLGASSGAVAGLVCITPAAGYVGPMAAIGMGLLAGAVCYWGCAWLKQRCGYDDALDAFGVHGLGGTLGAVLTGVFATRNINNLKGGGAPIGWIDGEISLVLAQIVAVTITYVLAIVGSFVILKVIDLTIGLRAHAEDEQKGLDVTQHGEEGYIFL